jgi:iron complex outermembrane receptor protein
MKRIEAQQALLGTANTDQDEIFQTALTTNNISVSGALFDKLPVRLSVGNVDKLGILLRLKELPLFF